MKTILGILLAATVTCGLGSWYWWSRREETPSFRTLPVDRGNLLIAISATGTVEPEEVVDVGAQIVGRIESFGPDKENEGTTIDYGSRVKQGDVLAQLDDSSQATERDKSNASLKLARAELQRYQAKLRQAERDFKRAEVLRDTNAESEYDMARAEYEMAEAEVAVAEAKLEQANIAMQQAEINLGYTIIRAPIDGVVIDRRVNAGQTVVAGLNAPSLFLLARDLDRMRVWTAVNEADMGDIHVGQRATFQVDAFRDDTFEGRVSQVRLNAAMSNNVVTYGVMVDIDNTEGKLLPYMTANLEFEVAGRSDVKMVPNQALRWKPALGQVSPSVRKHIVEAHGSADPGLEDQVRFDSPAVWVVAEDGFVRPIEVAVGLSDGTMSEIVKGDLEPGMHVVVGTVREARKDFVSSFVSRVVK
ncbi:MAG: efflux RND transporter periplasmic adaptor subunit [Pirellulaceae bacterium]